MSKKNIFLSLLIITILSMLTFVIFQEEANAPEREIRVNTEEINNNEPENISASNEIIYYYGEECPHCQDVLRFLEENKISEKVEFQKKEVWHNKNNSEEMMKKVGECELNPDTVGVPFLYAEGKCLIGTPKVEGFFKLKAGI
ncbi:MAG: hypothetical protein UR69_C0003G0023 [Candidatus Moranbacteria bacterium GW2011_GWE2_35_2-]|nr:MAG: hypothetical protein UR69_C0003G0023 [Candidatus Moranbacteria bacterium GW2011_GWE2_35_2-]KKQ29205.1 MAG: hypothetical protein US44_C0003G0118 [Candidatus Moranbacteria bacterium GW2011_GWD1_37_17]KKQ31190.1 MAG: hypothetical protein US47_C0001G0424 [Candidatus Moranbacteria bacterium GW2011_GWE1_37_24]KKQ47440.1 MAG: hypothetical protein US66_C0012G0057 [Candidatus Moranbacteria bacterium GW2011_GWD2_37_9]